jgi:hypothetical protein
MSDSEKYEGLHDQHSSPTNMPHIFSLDGPSLETKLRKEILSFMRDANNLVSLQPCFATFCLSSDSIPNWETDLVQNIYQSVFDSPESGHDAKFQETYNYHMKW